MPVVRTWTATEVGTRDSRDVMQAKHLLNESRQLLEGARQGVRDMRGAKPGQSGQTKPPSEPAAPQQLPEKRRGRSEGHVTLLRSIQLCRIPCLSSRIAASQANMSDMSGVWR